MFGNDGFAFDSIGDFFGESTTPEYQSNSFFSDDSFDEMGFSNPESSVFSENNTEFFSNNSESFVFNEVYSDDESSGSNNHVPKQGRGMLMRDGLVERPDHTPPRKYDNRSLADKMDNTAFWLRDRVNHGEFGPESKEAGRKLLDAAFKQNISDTEERRKHSRDELERKKRGRKIEGQILTNGEDYVRRAMLDAADENERTDRKRLEDTLKKGREKYWNKQLEKLNDLSEKRKKENNNG